MQLRPPERANGAVSRQVAPHFNFVTPDYTLRAEPKWRNWQTRRTQNPVPFGECGFDSHLRHRWVAGVRSASVFALAACAGGAVAQAPAGTAACEGTPRVAPDPGYRMLFDGTRASFARWAHAGPGRFELQADCTLKTAGGLGLLWYDDEPFDSPLTLKVEWMIPGDANSGVFVGFPAVGNDPFVAVNQGYEIQIDPTDPASSTGAIYSFQPADRARRDQALRPAGEWNTYEITVDAPRIVVRLNGVVVNRFVSTSAARQSLGRGFVGLQNHSDADRVSFRSVQVKEWGGERPSCAGGTPRRTPSDAFSGSRLDGCRWNRIVRYDGGGLDVSGGALHLELTAATSDPGATSCSSGRRAGAWTIETTVRVPLRSGSQQAGLLAYRDDGDYVKLVAAAAGGRVQLRLVSEAGDVVARNAPAATTPRPRSDTYRLRLARSGSRYTGSLSVNGSELAASRLRRQQPARRGSGVRAGRARAGTKGAPPYAAFEASAAARSGLGGSRGRPETAGQSLRSSVCASARRSSTARKAVTTVGSNCVPEQARSSWRALSTDRACGVGPASRSSRSTRRRRR